jgi:queuine tRNA-ribosyltransferase
VPVFNAQEGLSLTPQQWKTTGIQVFAFDVLNLLQRPGYPYVFDIKKYMGCPGRVILDTRMLHLNTKDEVVYRRPDGSLQKLSLDKLALWLVQLGADEVIWAFKYELQGITQAKSEDYNISNQVALDTMSGRVYQGKELYSILDPQYEMNFSPLALDCDCQACQQGVTRAYIHHLLPHTPLLAQRYVMMHNMWQISHS